MITKQQTKLFAAAGFVVMWSSGFIGARLGTAEANTFTLLMWRFIAAAIILGGWWLWKQRKKISAKTLFSQAMIGLFAQGGYLLCVFLSIESGVSAGTSNLITTLQPIAAAALAGPVLKESATIRQWFGLLLGISGVLLVVLGDLGSAAGVPLWGYALSFMAVISLVCATLYEKKTKDAVSIMDALPIQTLISAFLFTILAAATGHTAPPVNPDFWMAAAWLAILSTIGGYGFYWLNLKLGSVTRVSSLLYLTPPFTMLWAFFMFGDKIGSFTLAGMIICLIGVWIIRKE
ncbi:DMT family transporter [Metabacillus sp. 113a]|uniref:DMT family transporter n=1 Tax=Metabacillus sp. 113a TaxID=3404706 RepID=UPI003CF6FD23